MNVPRSRNVRPLRDEIAIRIEYLDAIVLPVANEHSTPVINANVVWQRELTRTLAWETPRQLEISLSIEAMHAAITVTVRDEHSTVRRNSHSRG